VGRGGATARGRWRRRAWPAVALIGGGFDGVGPAAGSPIARGGGAVSPNDELSESSSPRPTAAAFSINWVRLPAASGSAAAAGGGGASTIEPRREAP